MWVCAIAFASSASKDRWKGLSGNISACLESRQIFFVSSFEILRMAKAHRTLGVQASVFKRRVSGDTNFCCSAQCGGVCAARQLVLFSAAWPPEGRPGMSDVSPLSGIIGLSFDSTLLSPLLFFCLVLLPFLSDLFLPAGPFFYTFSRKFFSIFR